MKDKIVVQNRLYEFENKFNLSICYTAIDGDGAIYGYTSKPVYDEESRFWSPDLHNKDCILIGQIDLKPEDTLEWVM